MRTCSRTATLAFLKGDAAQMAQMVGGRHGQAGHGRLAAGHASGHGGMVREVEERARTDAAGDGFSPAQRCQRDGRSVSGSGGAARGGIGQPGAGSCRCRRGNKAGPKPRRAGNGGARPGPGRRYGRGGEAGCGTRQDFPAGHAGSKILAAHDPGRLSLCSAKIQTGQSNY